MAASYRDLVGKKSCENVYALHYVAVFVDAVVVGPYQIVVDCKNMYIQFGGCSDSGVRSTVTGDIGQLSDPATQLDSLSRYAKCAAGFNEAPGWGAVGFYHFMMETVVGIMYMYDILVADPEIVILVPLTGPSARFTRPLLELLGIASSRIVEWKPPYRAMCEQVRACFHVSECARACVCSHSLSPTCSSLSLVFVQVYAPPEQLCGLPAGAPLRLLQSAVWAAAEAKWGKAPEGDVRTILVLRRTGARTLDNHEALLSSLKSWYPSREIVDFPTEPTFEQTLTEFRRAAVIIGQGGAGLSNVVFARSPDTLVIEINPVPSDWLDNVPNPCHRE
jgi:hypothetical protein